MRARAGERSPAVHGMIGDRTALAGTCGGWHRRLAPIWIVRGAPDGAGRVSSSSSGLWRRRRRIIRELTSTSRCRCRGWAGSQTGLRCPEAGWRSEGIGRILLRQAHARYGPGPTSSLEELWQAPCMVAPMRRLVDAGCCPPFHSLSSGHVPRVLQVGRRRPHRRLPPHLTLRQQCSIRRHRPLSSERPRQSFGPVRMLGELPVRGQEKSRSCRVRQASPRSNLV